MPASMYPAAEEKPRAATTPPTTALASITRPTASTLIMAQHLRPGGICAWASLQRPTGTVNQTGARSAQVSNTCCCGDGLSTSSSSAARDRAIVRTAFVEVMPKSAKIGHATSELRGPSHPHALNAGSTAIPLYRRMRIDRLEDWCRSGLRTTAATRHLPGGDGRWTPIVRLSLLYTTRRQEEL